MGSMDSAGNQTRLRDSLIFPVDWVADLDCGLSGNQSSKLTHNLRHNRQQKPVSQQYLGWLIKYNFIRAEKDLKGWMNFFSVYFFVLVSSGVRWVRADTGIPPGLAAADTPLAQHGGPAWAHRRHWPLQNRQTPNLITTATPRELIVYIAAI